MTPKSTLEVGVAKVNLTTDLRNIIHQINPNDLLCAYKPTFERWATRTLQDLDPDFGMWEGKGPNGYTESPGSKDVIQNKEERVDTQCADSAKSVVKGWEVCPASHNGASEYRRDFHGTRISKDRRSQSSSAVDKNADSRRLLLQDKARFKLGLHLTRKSVQDVRLRDSVEEKVPAINTIHNSLSRPCSPKQLPFQHYENDKQHIDVYREGYTYRKIQLHKNQYVRRALACGLALQNYPLRGLADIPCAYCPNFVRSPIPKEQGLITTHQSNCLLKTTTRAPQLQNDVLVTERRRNVLCGSSNRTMTPIARKDRLVNPVTQSLVGLNNGLLNLDMYQEPLGSLQNSSSKDKASLDVPLIVCRAHPPLPKTSQPEKMYHLMETNADTLVSDMIAPQKK